MRNKKLQESDNYNDNDDMDIALFFIISFQGEYYSTDWSPASKTIGEKRVGSDSGALKDFMEL